MVASRCDGFRLHLLGFPETGRSVPVRLDVSSACCREALAFLPLSLSVSLIACAFLFLRSPSFFCRSLSDITYLQCLDESVTLWMSALAFVVHAASLCVCAVVATIIARGRSRTFTARVLTLIGLLPHFLFHHFSSSTLCHEHPSIETDESALFLLLFLHRANQ